MPKGGYKPGSGRPREANSRRSLIQAGLEAKGACEAPESQDEAPPSSNLGERLPQENLDPLAYMLRVMNDPGAEPERRDRLAIAAAPFVHPRANETKLGKKEEQAERAKAAGSGRFAPPPPPRMHS